MIQAQDRCCVVTHVVLQKLLAPTNARYEGRSPIIVHVVDTLQRRPLPPAFQKLCPQPLGVSVVLDGVSLERVDFLRSLEPKYDDLALHPTERGPLKGSRRRGGLITAAGGRRRCDLLALARRPQERKAIGGCTRPPVRLVAGVAATGVRALLGRVDALAEHVVEGAHLVLDLGRAEDLERAGLAGDGALGDDDGARYEDGVEEVERDLAVCGEVGNPRERAAVVLAQVFEQDADRGVHVVLLRRARLGTERLLILLKLGEESEKEMWVKL